MCAASTLAPGAVFAVADSDALGLDTQHGAVVAATADSVKGAEALMRQSVGWSLRGR